MKYSNNYDMLVNEIIKEVKNEMIKPGTPVRCRDHEDNYWNVGELYYIGVARNGSHVVEDVKGLRMALAYVERMPRVLVTGDMVYTSDRSSLSAPSGPLLVFDGMYKEYFVVQHENGILNLWKYAIHVDDIGEE